MFFAPVVNIPGNAATATSSAACTAIASVAEQRLGASITALVTPGRQQYHPSSAKAWVLFNGAGVPSIAGSYNIASITDNGLGSWSVNLTNAFSNTNFAVAACGFDNGSGQGAVMAESGTRTVSKVDVESFSSSTLALFDSIRNQIVFYGE